MLLPFFLAGVIFVIVLVVVAASRDPPPAPKPPAQSPSQLAPPPGRSPSVVPSEQGGDFGKYYSACSGECDTCLMPGWCDNRKRCGQCMCLEGKVCVPAGGLGCQAHGRVVTTHDQDILDGSGEVLRTACVDLGGETAWLPRCEGDISCPGGRWTCDRGNPYQTVSGVNTFVCKVN